MEEQKRMRVTEDFNHLISLLADSLYTTSDVFVRELTQNGHDGIIRRQARKEEGYQGEIHVDYAPDNCSISFTDNGEGMDRNDIENFLSVIGSAGAEKSRRELGEAVSLNLIGQFGIGILSAFAAGSEVTLETRKVGSAVGYRWNNKGSMEYALSETEREEFGTTVTIRLKPALTWLLDGGKLKDLLIRYCDFITVPVYVNGDAPVNVVRAPWDREPFPSEDEERKAYLQMVSRRFPDRALEVCPLRIDAQENGARCRTRGALYIPDRRTETDGGTTDIFIRRMLVKERDRNLLPSWAGFLRAIVDSPDLQPNTGRDNINQESLAYRILQRELEKAALDWLTDLANGHPDVFNKVCGIHSAALKSLALVNDRFFNDAAVKLRFDTNAGEMSFEEYLSKVPPQPSLLGLSGQRERRPINYYTRSADAGSYERQAREKGYLLIRATNPRDAELLEMYAARHPEVVLNRLNGLDKRLFIELSQENRRRFAALESHIADYLDGAHIDAEARTVHFAPSDAPADIIESADDRTFRELRERLDSPALAQDFKDAFQPLRRGRKAKLGARLQMQLALNADNPLIQSLAELAEAESPTLSALLPLLWNNALLYADRMRDAETRERLHRDIVRLMEGYLKRREASDTPQAGTDDPMETLRQQNDAVLSELRNVREAHMKSRDEFAALRESLQKFGEEVREQAMNNAESQRSEHITLFMITPFKDEYKTVRQAVKRVFEMEPFCFEVQIATDQYGEAELRKNIRFHMGKAHGFVAEISEQNANVMIELGAVLMSGDERFLFPLEARPRKIKELADIKGLLTFDYPGSNASLTDIENAIKAHLYKDGEIINDKLKRLIATERKALYLSDALLEAHSRLSADERKKVLEEVRPHTVEAFLAADAKELGEVTDISHYQLAEAQERMTREVKRKCDSYGG